MSGKTSQSVIGDRLYTSGTVAKLTGVSRRTLQHWRETGLVAASHRTSGGHHRYTDQDLINVRFVRTLRDRAKVSTQQARRIVPVVWEFLEDEGYERRCSPWIAES